MSALNAASSLPEVEEFASQDGPVVAALRDFRVVSNPVLARLIRYYLLILALVLLPDLLIFQGNLFLIDLPRSTGYVIFGFTAVLFVRLYEEVPATLKTLWDRGVVRYPNGKPVPPEAYARFVKEFEHHLNNRWGWIIGLTVVPLNYALVILGLALFPIGAGKIVTFAFLFSLFVWFLRGVSFWRVIVIAYMVFELSRQFNLTVQPAHPDKSGGLAPLGGLCLTNSLVVGVHALYFAGWIFVLSSPKWLRGYQQLVGFLPYVQRGGFQSGLILLLLLGLAIFILPLNGIHNDMLKQRVEHQKRLDNLTRRIDDIAQELLKPSKALDSAETQRRLDSLKSIRQVYEENEQFPVWPFNREILLKLTTSQVVPLLSLTGLAKPILDLIGNFLNLLQQ